jgi:hypothetical protein
MGASQTMRKADWRAIAVGRREWAAAVLAAFCLASAWQRSAAAQPADADEPKTLKERLSDKASDEQRVDNCKVAADRRGAKSRSDCQAASEAGMTAGAQR